MQLLTRAPFHDKLPPVIAEQFFGPVWTRERKRADRSGHDCILLLVEIDPPLSADSSAIWEATLAALAAARRDTDLLAWVEWRVAVGVIVTDIDAVDAADERERFDFRFRRELSNRLHPQTIDSLSIRIRIHPEEAPEEKEHTWEFESRRFSGEDRDCARRCAYHTIKRAQDIVGSFLLLVLLSPVFLLIAVLVKATSRGPVFFAQTRIGQMMKPFTMFKFRTMHSNADPRLHQEFVSAFIRATGEFQQSSRPRAFKLTSDPRITWIGRLLRKTSLDELPQLWNVLLGNMSLVGPRPPLPYELEQYKPWHVRRVLEAKPGITGLWQVTGRSRTTFDDMVRLDLRYARTCSLWTDLRILLATPTAIITGKGAC